MFTTSTPTYAPLPQVHNTRRATCRRCRTTLPAGAGQGWTLQTTQFDPSPFYLCPACSLAQQVEEDGLLQAAVHIDSILMALHTGAGLGFFDRDRVLKALRSTGKLLTVAAASTARQIANLADLGEPVCVWDVVTMIQEYTNGAAQ